MCQLSEDNFQKLVLSFHQDSTWVTRLYPKNLLPELSYQSLKGFFLIVHPTVDLSWWLLLMYIWEEYSVIKYHKKISVILYQKYFSFFMQVMEYGSGGENTSGSQM